MIFFDRSRVPAPEVLTQGAAVEETSRIRSLLSSVTAGHLAQLRVTHESRIWMSARPSLLELFRHKCAYCESPLELSQPGDIEHFRPKQNARSIDQPFDALYYTWLAYDWDNLLILCMDCNRRRSHGAQGGLHGKGELFPVEGARAPLLSSVAECRKLEKPYLLDPCHDDPARHIRAASNGELIGTTNRGQATIDILGLNARQGLVNARAHAYSFFILSFEQLLRVAGNSNTSNATDEVESFLRKAISGEEPYTAAVRSAYQDTQDRVRASGLILPAMTWEMPVQTSQAASVEAAPTTGVIEPNVARIRDFLGRKENRRQRLRRIEIRNFKTIEALDLELPEDPQEGASAMAILGENATGKSSILEAIALALIGTGEIGRLQLDGRRFLRQRGEWTPDTTNLDAAEIRLLFEGASEPVSLRIDPRSGEFSGQETPSSLVMAYGPRRFFSTRPGWTRPRGASNQVKSLFMPQSVLTNPKGWLLRCNQKQFDAVVRALRSLLMMPDEHRLKRPELPVTNESEILIEVQGTLVPLDRLSEGYKTIVAAGVDIMRELLGKDGSQLENAQGIVLIDELETHLHPRWKMRIAQLLRKAMPQVQFIATSHDPLCLRGFHDGEVQVLRRNPSRAVERVQGLPNVRGLSVQQLLTSEFFGLFSAEDPSIESEMARYVALATKRDRGPDDEKALEYQRELASRTIQLGETPSSAIVQAAIQQYIVESRTSPQREKPGLRRAAVASVVDFWRSLDKEGKPAEDNDGMTTTDS